MKENTADALYNPKSGLAPMVGSKYQEPARAGDCLTKEITTIKQILGDDESERVAAACEFMSLQMQIRREQSARTFFQRMAAVFRQ